MTTKPIPAFPPKTVLFYFGAKALFVMELFQNCEPVVLPPPRSRVLFLVLAQQFFGYKCAIGHWLQTGPGTALVEKGFMRSWSRTVYSHNGSWDGLQKVIPNFSCILHMSSNTCSDRNMHTIFQIKHRSLQKTTWLD